MGLCKQILMILLCNQFNGVRLVLEAQLHPKSPYCITDWHKAKYNILKIFWIWFFSTWSFLNIGQCYADVLSISNFWHERYGLYQSLCVHIQQTIVMLVMPVVKSSFAGHGDTFLEGVLMVAYISFPSHISISLLVKTPQRYKLSTIPNMPKAF